MIKTEGDLIHWQTHQFETNFVVVVVACVNMTSDKSCKHQNKDKTLSLLFVASDSLNPGDFERWYAYLFKTINRIEVPLKYLFVNLFV